LIQKNLQYLFIAGFVKLKALVISYLNFEKVFYTNENQTK